ncbi:MAG: cyclopropane-fatty-acyl-phospholipid synthase, partial [Actinomycetota bacterium]|nr:cyclopropane-fatty-acyl-phospholipid synthase [Actinomycetota bacterium]
MQLEERASQQPSPDRNRNFGLAAAIGRLLGGEPPVAVECYDGSRIGPADSASKLVVRSPLALRYVLTAPGELGFARAYVSGELDVEGDIFEVLALRDNLPDVKLGATEWIDLARLAGAAGLRPLPPPPEEARLHGRRHSKERDAAAIAHHYDVSNDFYRLVLGPSMTYSCAVWSSPDGTLEDAQAAKHELVSRKLGLEPGMRLLDVGCGWGSMVIHAAKEHGVRAVVVTLSQRQADWARRAAHDAGLGDQVEIRLQDYRDIHDGPFDAISSIGMFEHVGLSQLERYFDQLYALLVPEG